MGDLQKEYDRHEYSGKLGGIAKLKVLVDGDNVEAVEDGKPQLCRDEDA